jgi:hypothetical protein
MRIAVRRSTLMDELNMLKFSRPCLDFLDHVTIASPALFADTADDIEAVRRHPDLLQEKVSGKG